MTCGQSLGSILFRIKQILKILWKQIFDIRNYKFYRCNNDVVVIFLKCGSPYRLEILKYKYGRNYMMSGITSNSLGEKGLDRIGYSRNKIRCVLTHRYLGVYYIFICNFYTYEYNLFGNACQNFFKWTL